MKTRWIRLQALTMTFAVALASPGTAGVPLPTIVPSVSAAASSGGGMSTDEATTAVSIGSDSGTGAGTLSAAGTGTLALLDRLADAVVLLEGSPMAWNTGEIELIDPDQPGLAVWTRGGVRMAPVRFLVESLGGSVEWDARTGATVLRLDTVTVRMKAGESAFTVNSLSGSFGAKAALKDGRLFAPAGALIAALGMECFETDELVIASPYRDILDRDEDATVLDALVRALSSVRRIGSAEELAALMQERMSGGLLPGTFLEGDALVGPSLSVDGQTSGTIAGSSADSSAGPPAGSAPDSAANPGAASEGKSASTAPAASADSDSEAGHSTTNVQVEGVDEGDLVKTDGKHLYAVNGDRVLIVSTPESGALAIESTVSLRDESFSPTELHLSEGRLTVIGSTWLAVPQPVGPAWRDSAAVSASSSGSVAEPAEPAARMPAMMQGDQSVRVLEYDVTNAAKPVLVRDFEIEGSLLSSRRVDNRLVLVTNSWSWGYGYAADGSVPTPVYRSGSGGWKAVAPTDIRYCPDFRESNFLAVTTIDLKDPARVAEPNVVLGAGTTMYMSENSLYVTSQNWNSWPVGILAEPAADEEKRIGIMAENLESTDILRFDLSDGAASLVAKGSVPGHLLNSFSMDESDGRLRVAVTVGWASQSGAATSSNNLYVLDGAMRTIGRLEGLAPGEQIYACRFIGQRAYLVTYQTTDPLFVLDLSDPAKPRAVGELKIPGYSSYLHPIDATHLVGFGKDSVEIASEWDPGTKWAYTQGMKAALFDVSDISAPKMISSVSIGDRGTDSELLWNHRALLAMPSMDLLAFPVSVCEVKPGSVPASEEMLAWGELIWQGMVVYRVSPESGFKEIGRVSHAPAGYPSDTTHWISRGVIVGNRLITISPAEIRSNRLDTMAQTDSINIP